MQIELATICIEPNDSIRRAMECIEKSSSKVALVVDSQQRLFDTITDGDIRRAILAGEHLDARVSNLTSRKAESPNPRPITATAGTSRKHLLRLMQEKGIRQVPLLDADSRLVELATLQDLLPDEDLPLRALVMAGGYGVRLRPLTENIPKPMLPVGGRPLLELTIEQLSNAGIRKVNLATHYKGKVISDHFGNGQDFQVDIQYIEEDQPLGTAGALRLLDDLDEPLLVMNGDILTRIDFRAMLDYHLENQADMTVAVKEHEVSLPYGVIDLDGIDIKSISEKPALRHFVNAGIYLLNPRSLHYIPKGQPSDMPDLIETLLNKNARVISFPVHEYWADIGQVEDYQRVQLDSDQSAQ